jgi:hypothetical protein
MGAPRLEHRMHDYGIEPCRVRKRRPRLVGEPGWPVLSVPRDPLVRRLSTDAELLAQVRHRAFSLQIFANQQHPFVHS